METIKFYPKHQLAKEVVPMPKPSTNPFWYKQVPLHTNEENTLDVRNGAPNYSVKACMPFFDTFVTGYTISAWCDIQVRNTNGFPELTWGTIEPELSPVNERRAPIGIPVEDGFNPMTFSWVTVWGIKTPKGYSSLFTHPLNRPDLPFRTASGIMDTDGWGIWGNQPFALKKGWEGVIEAGTPIVQVIPFKREEWKSEVDDSLTDWANFENLRRASKFRNYYKGKYWNRKSFS